MYLRLLLIPLRIIFSLGGLFWSEGEEKEEGSLGSTSCHFLESLRERNRRAFEGVEIPIQRLKDNFIKILYFWESGKFSSSSLEMVGLLDSLYIGCI